MGKHELRGEHGPELIFNDPTDEDESFYEETEQDLIDKATPVEERTYMVPGAKIYVAHLGRGEINDPSRATDPEPDGQSYPEVVVEDVTLSEDGEHFYGTVRIPGEAPVEGEYPEVVGIVTEPGGIAAGETGTVRLGGGFPVPEMHKHRDQLAAYQHGLDMSIRQEKIEAGEFRCPTCSFSAFLERPDNRGILIYHRGRYFPCRAPEGYVRQTNEKGELKP